MNNTVVYDGLLGLGLREREGERERESERARERESERDRETARQRDRERERERQRETERDRERKRVHVSARMQNSFLFGLLAFRAFGFGDLRFQGSGVRIREFRFRSSGSGLKGDLGFSGVRMF